MYAAWLLWVLVSVCAHTVDPEYYDESVEYIKLLKHKLKALSSGEEQYVDDVDPGGLKAHKLSVMVQNHHRGLMDKANLYMRTLSYCPQSATADAFQTGRRNLRMLLTLRGLSAADVTAVTCFWLEQFDLTELADKRVSCYSAGCLRRLAVASALCQDVPTTLLDEPTAGVDPVARRRMHLALLRARLQRSLIIGSHSLDEIEALCHRIAIMAGGELQALGSAAELKAQYGQGYSVVFKLSVQKNADGKLDEFKGQMMTQFNCELLGEYQYTLSYRVNDSLPFSEMFSRLEQLQEQFSELVEDYTLSETTLEEVFLALAKKARTFIGPYWQ